MSSAANRVTKKKPTRMNRVGKALLERVRDD